MFQNLINPELFVRDSEDSTLYTEVTLFDMYAAFALTGILATQPSSTHIDDLTDSVCEASCKFAAKMLEKRQQYLTA